MSNRELGEQFARKVGEYLAREGYIVRPEYAVEVGLSSRHKKIHCFDLGNESLLVECKCYDWTEGGNNPSAKISTLNEAMMHFHSAPTAYRKLLFILKTRKNGKKRPETVAEHYVRLNKHLIPDDVEVWEFDEASLCGSRLFPGVSVLDPMPSPRVPTDTTRTAATVQARIVRGKSGAQRLLTALEMSSTARELSLARLRRQHPDWSEAQLRRELLRYSFLPDELPPQLR